MDKKELRHIFGGLGASRVRGVMYEGVDRLNEKEFQRAVFLLERDHL